MINCIIIDDEPIARKGLTEYIQDLDFLELKGSFDNPLKAADILQQQKIDLIFLDIQMPRMTGLNFLKHLSSPPMIIFTTAYPQFAVEGFELNAIDYLIKPFSFERFWKAAQKARQYAESLLQNPAAGQEKSDPDCIFIKTDNKLVRILYDDLLFVEALQNYVAVHTKEKKYLTYLTFKMVEEHLPSTRFLKVHKSYIVSIARIDSIEGNGLRIGPHWIPVSRSAKDEVMERILKNRYLKRE